MMIGQHHDRAWRYTIPGLGAVVVVEIKGVDRPYWWVLCPATATLILPAHADDDGLGTVNECSDPGCQFDELHDRAAKCVKYRARKSRLPAPAPIRDRPQA